ncbi:MAG: hypothetical protein KAI50_11625 [Desulfobacterales bacterium]|nr:hypothetical protein [Desulfobacterales bacterium]
MENELLIGTPELRKKLRKFLVEFDKAYQSSPRRQLPAYPEECSGMTCGAKTRAGTPCKRKDLYFSGRCKLHGGLSTGPKTKEGKRRSALNGLLPKKKRTS